MKELYYIRTECPECDGKGYITLPEEGEGGEYCPECYEEGYIIRSSTSELRGRNLFSIKKINFFNINNKEKVKILINFLLEDKVNGALYRDSSGRLHNALMPAMRPQDALERFAQEAQELYIYINNINVDYNYFKDIPHVLSKCKCMWDDCAKFIDLDGHIKIEYDLKELWRGGSWDGIISINKINNPEIKDIIGTNKQLLVPIEVVDCIDISIPVFGIRKAYTNSYGELYLVDHIFGVWTTNIDHFDTGAACVGDASKYSIGALQTLRGGYLQSVYSSEHAISSPEVIITANNTYKAIFLQEIVENLKEF